MTMDVQNAYARHVRAYTKNIERGTRNEQKQSHQRIEKDVKQTEDTSRYGSRSSRTSEEASHLRLLVFAFSETTPACFACSTSFMIPAISTGAPVRKHAMTMPFGPGTTPRASRRQRRQHSGIPCRSASRKALPCSSGSSACCHDPCCPEMLRDRH